MKGKAKHCIALIIALLICTTAFSATEIVEGETGPGAKYLLAVPDSWNGDLVVYAHGYIDTAVPIGLPTADDIEQLRDTLTDNGYAVAYSSYSKFGFAVKEGIKDTQKVESIFRNRFGNPDRTFLVGHSLGGLVCVRLAEKLPNRYDGILTMAGMIGGSPAEIEYMANVRILFELHYPGVLPGTIDHVPDDLDLNTDVIGPLVYAIQSNPTNAIAITMIDQTPVPWEFGNGTELVYSFAYAIGFYYRGHADLTERTGTPVFFDNEDTVYTSMFLDPLDMQVINYYVPRFATTSRSANYLRKNDVPTGRLRAPHLALHNSRDPVVPVFHQALYADAVYEQGNEDLLVQRIIDRIGHTEPFVADEAFSAFEELVEWVDTGIAPAP